MTTGYAARVEWRRASACADHTCVEVGHDGADVLVRDGKDPSGPVLRFTAAEFAAFLEGAKGGEFDDATGAGALARSGLPVPADQGCDRGQSAPHVRL